MKKKEILKVLIDRDMTRADLAKKMNVSTSYVNSLINNKKNVSLEKAKFICEILEVKLDDIF